MRGGEAVILHKGRLVIYDGLRNALFGEHHVRPFRNELERIAVARDEERVYPLLFRHAGDRAQNIIRLIAEAFADGDAHAFQQFLQCGKLRAKILGSFAAARLIFGVGIVAEGAARYIERDEHIIGLHFDELQKHCGEAVYGVCGSAVAAGHGGLDGVIRPEQERVAVDGDEFFHGFFLVFCAVAGMDTGRRITPPHPFRSPAWGEGPSGNADRSGAGRRR